MKDRVAAVERSAHGVGVQHVAAHELDAGREHVAGRRKPVKRDDPGAVRGQRGDHVTSEEARCAGDQRPHQAAARRERRERAVPRAIRRPNRAIAAGTCSASAITAPRASAKRRTSASSISSDGSALITFIR